MGINIQIASELSKSVELEPIFSPNDEGQSAIFKIEVHKRFKDQKFYAEIFEKETYSLKPTFPVNKEDLWDDVIVVVKDHMSYQAEEDFFETCEESLENALGQIKRKLNID